MRPRQTQIAGAVLRNTHHQAYQQAVELLQQKRWQLKPLVRMATYNYSSFTPPIVVKQRLFTVHLLKNKNRQALFTHLPNSAFVLLYL